MRKILTVFLVAFAAIALFGCNKSDYQFDGEFLAFETSIHEAYGPSGMHHVSQVTWVTVTIEKGKIVKYNIDERQGTRIGEEGAYKFVWNEKTKKELKFDYGMLIASGIDKEWHEQAEAIEAEWLANGVDAVKFDSEGYIDNLAGATMIGDNYNRLAKEALQNAKNGKYQAIIAGGDPDEDLLDLYSIHMIVEKKKVKELVIDTLQMNGNASKASGNFEWNTKTKQELGFDYGMVQWAGAELEWFEQVNLITDDIIAKGWSKNAAENVPAGVTVTTNYYYALLELVFNYAGNSVK